MVDNLELAQFIYLILNNHKLRDMITSLTSKLVLILGRFTRDRLDVLESIKAKTRQSGFIPVIFTFEPSDNRDLTETIQLIAGMAKIVFADITEAKSIPQELSHIIPNFPSLIIQPLLLKEETTYSMFEHWEKYTWVRPVFEYYSKQHLINNIDKLLNT
jgi:hypothetical protein